MKELMEWPALARQRLRRASRLKGNTLVLLLPNGWPGEGGVVSWWLHGDKGLLLRGQVRDLRELPGEVAAANTHAWTPAGDTLLTRARIPTRSRAKIQQALPYALEDQLLGDPGELHFAYQHEQGGYLGVAVTARERLEAWRNALTSAGLNCVSLTPATLAPPLTTGYWTLAYAGEQAWLRTGELTGFACPVTAHEPPTLLSSALAEAREAGAFPSGLTVYQPPPELDSAAWSNALGLPVTARKLDFWSERGAASAPINLLQGEYAPSSGQAYELARALRPAAVMLAVWLAGNLAFISWEWRQLSQERAGVRQEMEALFRRTFPDAKTVVDPALQMQRILKDLQGNGGPGGAGDLLPMLTGIAPVMQSNPEARLRTLQYSESSLTLDLGVTDFQALEGIKNALSSRGMQVEVLSANSGTDGVEGRLRIKPGAGIKSS